MELLYVARMLARRRENAQWVTLGGGWLGQMENRQSDLSGETPSARSFIYKRHPRYKVNEMFFSTLEHTAIMKFN